MAGVFSADSLGTNHAVYKYVRCDLVKAREEALGIKVCLFLRCGIHQLNIVRRSLVCQFEAHWANIVRFAHLFESAAFKRRFRAALNYVILEKFDYVRMPGPLPQQVLQWQNQRAEFMRCHGDGLPVPKVTRLLLIDNSDPASERFVHICSGCCSSKMQAFEKMYAAYTSILIRGYPVPLLHRWKHYEPAKAFINRGLGLHQVLRQVFAVMQQGKAMHIEEAIGKGCGGESLATENVERQREAPNIARPRGYVALAMRARVCV